MHRIAYYTLVIGLLAGLFVMPQQSHGQNLGKESYRIGAGDVLEIFTWREPDLSREAVLVRIDGNISFPLIGDIKAEGRTAVELKSSIEKALKDYLSNPVVTVTITEPASQRFYILGEVVNTGEYPLRKNLTVLQAFAIAGGFTEWAAKDEILLMRKENGKDVTIRVDYKDIADGKNLDQNVPIKADDTIIVP